MESFAAAAAAATTTANPGNTALVHGAASATRTRPSLFFRRRSGVRVGAGASHHSGRAFGPSATVRCCCSSSSSSLKPNSGDPATALSVPSSSSAAAAAAAFVASAALLAAHLSIAPHAGAWTMGRSHQPAAAPPMHGEEEILPAPHASSPDSTKPTGLAALTDELLTSSPEAVSAVRHLVYRKLELGEDEEALKILENLTTARPKEPEWRLLSARVLNELSRLDEARSAYDAVLAEDPWCFEALFENSVLMDRMGEGAQALDRLRKAEAAARAEGKGKEAREARLIAAQVVFLQKKAEEALRRYDELAMEDAMDYRPHFCKGVIYTLTGRDDEARMEFGKCKQLAPGRFDVEGFAQTPLSRVQLFHTQAAAAGRAGGSKGGIRTKS